MGRRGFVRMLGFGAAALLAVLHGSTLILGRSHGADGADHR